MQTPTAAVSSEMMCKREHFFGIRRYDTWWANAVTNISIQHAFLEFAKPGGADFHAKYEDMATKNG